MIKAYIDASTKGNPGPSGGGWVLIGDDNFYQQISFPLPVLNNHQAEFASFLRLLDYLLEHDYHHQTVMVYTDSKILAQTIEKDFTANPDFRDYFHQIQQRLGLFSLILIQWIPEHQNKGADNLARQGLAKALRLQNR